MDDIKFAVCQILKYVEKIAQPQSETVRLTEDRIQYLDLLKKQLTDILNAGTVQITPYAPGQGVFYKRWAINWLVNFLAKKNIRLVMDATDDTSNREQGIGWPVNGLTMIGMKRMDNIQDCLVDIIERGVEGDVIETGVWKGGACIFMKRIIELFGEDRQVFVADSFAGLPKPDAKRYPEDEGDDLWSIEQLRITEDMVKANFAKYDVLDDKVTFLKGWFKDTLPEAPIKKLSLMRLDGDMYESTMDGLVNLYPKLSTGGYCIIDDYNAIPACKKAVHDYRDAHGVKGEIIEVDWSCVYWKKAD